jgi:hypothetical protein
MKFEVIIKFAFYLILNSAVLIAQQTPYHGAPISIPGTVETEDFDNGGEGVAYHDNDASNNGGQYRETGVDIEISSENNSPNVGWIATDEWLEYTVHVQTTGLYTFNVRVASESAGGTFRIEFNSVNVTGSQSFPATGGWQTWTTITIPDIVLSAGEQVMRFYMESSDFNVNYTQITFQTALSIPQVSITTPVDNSVFYLDQQIPIYAVATDSLATIDYVQFMANDILIGQDDSAPYELLWQPAVADNYDLIALAVNINGLQGSSEKVDIEVNLPIYENEIYFSNERGFYSAPFTLNVTGDAASTHLIFTLDGSNPENSPSAQTVNLPADILINPASNIGRGTTPGVVIRAFGSNNDIRQTDIETHSYIFVDAVQNQTFPGSPWLDDLGSQVFHYHMDQGVVSDPQTAGLMDDALLDIPSLSLVMESDDLFDPEQGIYVNAQYHGIEWERPVSAELINPDGSMGFQVNCGIRIRGGWSRHDNYPKHAFRLFFRRAYGPPKLIYPLFEDEGVDEFDKLDLRAEQNYSWANGSSKNSMVREVFSRDIQGAMGQPYSRSRIYHLYVNGLYFGLFQSQERMEANFAQSYLGGDAGDYDVIKIDIGDNFNLYTVEATDGNLDSWNQVWEKTQSGFASNASYFDLEGKNADGTANPVLKKLVDIDNLIDYMHIIFYTGNFDAPVSKFRGDNDPNNFYAIYNRNRNDGFKFFAHDAEHSLFASANSPGIGLNENRVDLSATVSNFDKFHPYWLHKQLTENPEYRMRFADRTYKHFFNGGAFTLNNLNALLARRVDELQLAVIAEAARWGDTSRDKARWLMEIDEITDQFFPNRTEILLDQLNSVLIYPNLTAPVFRNNGVEITATSIHSGGEYSIEFINNNGGGTIYYTLNGIDPRLIGGSVSPGALSVNNNGQIVISASATIKARIYSGDNWSALHELNIFVSQNLADLLVSEIHYHPLDEGDIGGGEYEFIELYNAGVNTLNLSFSSFVKAISYTFPSGTLLGAGQYLVLASNAGRFAERYGFNPFDEFSGQLDNSGEKIVLVDSNLDTLIQIRYYDDPPWPTAPDGDGYSLVWSNQSGDNNTSNPLNWGISAEIHGSPQQYIPVAIEYPFNTPGEFALQQNYPNPFNAKTVISYNLAQNSHVVLKIYDVNGREAATLVNQLQPAGNYIISYDASYLSSGLYFYKIQAGTYTKIRKMILVK